MIDAAQRARTGVSQAPEHAASVSQRDRCSTEIMAADSRAAAQLLFAMDNLAQATDGNRTTG
jgi:hypothetical protein